MKNNKLQNNQSENRVVEQLDSSLRYELTKEVKYFCSCLFKCPPSAELISTYLLAHEELPGNLLKGRVVINKIVDNRLDPIAIEFAQRKKLKSLNLKLILICYLAENLPGYEEYFVLKVDKKLSSFVSLIKILLHTPILYFKGHLIVKKHGLV